MYTNAPKNFTATPFNLLILSISYEKYLKFSKLMIKKKDIQISLSCHIQNCKFHQIIQEKNFQFHEIVKEKYLKFYHMIMVGAKRGSKQLKEDK